MTGVVLLVNDAAGVGGAQTVMADVAAALLGVGFDTHLASPAGRLVDACTALGATWHPFAFEERRMLSARARLPRLPALRARREEGRRLAALAADIGADIVHTGALVPHLDAVVPGRRRRRAKVVWHLQQISPPSLFACPLPDRIVSVSRAALEPARWRRAAVARARVIPNGVDPSLYRPPTAAERRSARELMGLGDELAILTVARLEPLKGIDTLIRAAARMARHAVLVVVGDAEGYEGGGAHAAHLQDLAHDSGVDVRFLGARTDVRHLMQGADVFGLASRWEAFGLVLLEASASGLPVVSSDAGGCGEVVVNGETGFLIDPEDVSGFASALDRLADEEERQRMGAAGRSRAVGTFTPHRLSDELVPLYRNLLRSA